MEYLVCPVCHGRLDVTHVDNESGEHILNGRLTCMDCGTHYPVQQGVPVLLSPSDTGVVKTDISTGDAYEQYFNVVFQGDGEAEQRLYGLTTEEEIKDFQQKTGIESLESLKDRVVVDAGCGAGRIEPVLAEHSRVVIAFDISPVVYSTFQQYQHVSNLHIVRASMAAIPLATHAFDVVWCDGVLPYVADWRRSLKELLRLRTHRGYLFTWCYDSTITRNESLGRIGHRLRLPVRLRWYFFLTLALIWNILATIKYRKNWIRRTHKRTSHILDWSLAGIVNHLDDTEVRRIIADYHREMQQQPPATVQNHRQRIHIHVGTIPASSTTPR